MSLWKNRIVREDLEVGGPESNTILAQRRALMKERITKREGDTWMLAGRIVVADGRREI